MKQMLLDLGYDKDFYSIRSRPINIVFHTPSQLEIHIHDAIYSAIDKISNLKIIEAYGTKRN